jgi:hypothetical protein
VWRRLPTLAVLAVFLSAGVGATDPALAISGSAGTGVAVAQQHSELGEQVSLGAEGSAVADAQGARQARAAAAAASGDELPISGWVALPGLLLGAALLFGGPARRRGLTDPAPSG